MDGVAGRKVILTEMLKILNSYNFKCVLRILFISSTWQNKKNLFKDTSGLWLIMVCGLFYDTNIQFPKSSKKAAHI